MNEKFEASQGCPLPLGANLTPSGVNFSLFSKHASSVTLVIFSNDKDHSQLEIPLDSQRNKTGDIWHIHIKDIGPGIEYGYRLDRRPNPNKKKHHYNNNLILVDPYAKALNSGHKWGVRASADDDHHLHQHRSIVIDGTFDWESDQPLNRPLYDTIIYELHVRGFTQHPSSKIEHPGTYKGLIEKIPYLKELGINAIELLPIYEFDETYNNNKNPLTGAPLLNYWGYDSICFFAPKASFAAEDKIGHHVTEFKSLVKALHRAGIEIILDVVFNHTAEGNSDGPTFSFRGLDNSIYYMIDEEKGTYHNFSGCGNTLNCNHPVVRDLIVDCLRYWVIEMHVDGFRFDLASILSRGKGGKVLNNPPLLERIAMDPILAKTKIIAEPWDAAGLYQVGRFPAWKRWAEWNGKYRDDLRRYIRGDNGMVPILATRIAGSSDLYRESGRAPYHSINYITCHDGFTLNDLVSYNKKNNESNGEKNRDGANENFSWNCGIEGPSNNLRINLLRKRQKKNMILLLLLSQGVPMLLAGDEMGRSQRGNNNAYCQDNDISWINWDLLHKNADLFRFFKLAIQFRKQHASLRRNYFYEDDPTGQILINWYGRKLNKPNWSAKSHYLAFHLLANEKDDSHIFVISNASPRKQNFQLPKLEDGKLWRRVADTFLESPNDIAKQGEEAALSEQNSYDTQPHSTAVLIA